MPVTPVAAVRSHPWHVTPHHLPVNSRARYRNIWADEPPPSFRRVLPWLLQSRFQTKDRRPATLVPLDPQALAPPPERLRLAWLGHSTVLVQMAGLNILTDPIFSDRCSPFTFMGPKRQVGLPIAPADLPRIDLVLLSHDHYDHFDTASLRFLQTRDQPLFAVPLDVAPLLPPGARSVCLDWHQYVDLEVPAGRLRLHMTPAKHFAGRTAHRNVTLWASYYLEPLDGLDAPRLFYAGDSGYASHFKDIRAQHGTPDVALMPIGAYLPRWLMAPVHVDPPEAVQALLDLGSPHTLPIHWGTFDLADEPLHEPANVLPALTAAAGFPADHLHLLPIGGTWELKR